MAKRASLPFRDGFQHVQGFGANPGAYAKFGLKGHDGDDWLMPAGTVLFSPVSGKIVRHGNDPDGWGIYLHVWDPNQRLLINIAHCSGLQVITGAAVRAGQRIAFSGNTGNSSAPHCHVAAADTDGGGNRVNLGNGYKGWYSILDGGKIELVGLGAESPAPTPETPGDLEVEGQEISWSDIFSQYYAGWDEASAKADFNITMEGNLEKLLSARGIVPGDVVSAPDPEKPIVPQAHWIKPAHVGKTAKQLQNETGQCSRLDILGEFINLGENVPIEATRQFDPTGFPDAYVPVSCEWEFFKRFFWTTPPLIPVTVTLPPPKIPTPSQPPPEEIGVPPEVAEGTSGFPVLPPPVDEEIPPVVPEEIPDVPPEEEPPEAPSGAPPPSGDLAAIMEKLETILVGLSDIYNKISAAPSAPLVTPPEPEEQRGGVYIESTPRRASIYIDGHWQADYTPSNAAHLLGPGSHEIRLKKRGFKDHVETVEIVGSETVELTVNLQPE